MKLITIKVEGYEGAIKIRPMRNVEKFELMQELGMNVESLTKMSQKKGKKLTPKDLGFDLSSFGKMLTASSKFIESVDLKREEEHYESWDDLDYSPDGLSIQLQVVNVVFGMGK